jgi:hypothetical protein
MANGLHPRPSPYRRNKRPPILPVFRPRGAGSPRYALNGGNPARPPVSPPPQRNQRRCAPYGWKPSPGLRPPSPASGGGKYPSDEALPFLQRNVPPPLPCNGTPLPQSQPPAHPPHYCKAPAVPSPACGGGCPVRGGRGFPSIRSEATLISLRWGSGQASLSFLPLFIQRRCAPDGTKPSPGLRPPSPASGGGKCPSEECAIAKAACPPLPRLAVYRPRTPSQRARPHPPNCYSFAMIPARTLPGDLGGNRTVFLSHSRQMRGTSSALILCAPPECPWIVARTAPEWCEAQSGTLIACSVQADVSIHARDRATTRGRADI